MALKINAAELNVELYESFYEKTISDNIYHELLQYPYEPISLCIYGRTFTPKRLVLGFGDLNTSYSFSGALVSGRPWTETLLKLKTDAEKITGNSFNYALLNYYPDGSSGIGQHADDESSLEKEAPIPCFSFGANRQMVFSRKDFESQTANLSHGSLLIMHPPTNAYWKHGIPVQVDVKSARISVTFRHIITTNAKRRRLEPAEGELSLPKFDTFEQIMMGENTKDLMEWNLGFGSFAYLKTDKNRIRIHIREKNLNNGIPSKNGVALTSPTWQAFTKKLQDYSCCYRESSFIANNQLAAFSVSKHCTLQQIFPKNDSFVLKTDSISLIQEQIKQLLKNQCEINERIIKTILSDLLPFQLLKTRKSCTKAHHDATEEKTKEAILQLFFNELAQLAFSLIKCNGCEYDSPCQLDHECLIYSDSDRVFHAGVENCVLTFDAIAFSPKVQQNICTCNFSEEFFSKICAEDYINYVRKKM